MGGHLAWGTYKDIKSSYKEFKELHKINKSKKTLKERVKNPKRLQNSMNSLETYKFVERIKSYRNKFTGLIRIHSSTENSKTYTN